MTLSGSCVLLTGSQEVEREAYSTFTFETCDYHIVLKLTLRYTRHINKSVHSPGCARWFRFCSYWFAS